MKGNIGVAKKKKLKRMLRVSARENGREKKGKDRAKSENRWKVKAQRRVKEGKRGK